MKAVNLLSRGAKPPGALPGMRVLASLALLLLAGVVVIALVHAQAERRAARNDAQLASLRQQLALAELAQEQQQLAVSPGEESGPGLRSAVVAALEGRAQWGGLLRGIGRVMPPGAWLTKLSLGKSGVSVEGSETSSTQPPAPASEVPAVGQAPSEVALSMTGCALNQSMVGRVVSGLGRLPGATEVSASAKQTGEGEGSSCGGHPSFELSFNVSGSAL